MTKMKQIMTLLLLMLIGGVIDVQAAELVLTPSDGTYASGGNYVNTLTFSNVTPTVTITASANNMDKRQTSEYLLWHSGSAQSGTYTISVSDTYLITAFTLTATANSSDQTVTAGNVSQTFTSSADATISVTNLSTSSTSFTLSGANTGLKVSKIVLTVEENNSYVAPSSYICTINNTNTSRGALMYAPSQSTKWVWSSGKNSQTFEADNANCQWLFVETGSTDEYYLYNLGAGKFAIPITGGTYSGLTWAFSNDAVAVKLMQQGDGTYKIKTVTSDTYMAVSNGYEGPIINYNDEGGNFTISEAADLSSSVTTAAEQAVARLIHNTTPLTALPTVDGWYAVRVKTHGTYPDYYLFAPEEEIAYNGTNYALDFYNAAKVRPAIDNSTYYFRIAQDGTGYDWQMPNGRYLCNNANKFPVSTETATAISIDYSTNGFRFYHNSRYAVPYLLNSIYFVGETSSSGNAYYDIYPIDLTTAGLTAWQVLCDDAAATTEITCTRTDVSGLTSVYKNGYFFLPTGVTPEESDFSMSGGQSYTVNADNKTVTIEYDPRLAITAEGVTVYQGYGTTGLGNEKAVLLRMQVAPFNAMENAEMTFTLTNPDNISAVKVIETDNNVEFNSISSYTNTFEGTINDGTATVAIGSVSAGTHYYWLCATVADDATVGEDIDASLTGMTYDYNGYTGTTCDLSAVGDPANSMKIFDVQSYPFYPGQEISGTTSAVYRIPAVASVEMPNGTTRIFSAVDKRYNSYTDIGGGHVIDIVVRYSDDGGKTWSTPVTIAKGDNSNDATCGYGDPSFTIGANGKIFCLFAAGNTGFFYGLNRIVMCTSEDYGETWTGPSVIAPASDSTTGITFTDHAGLYDYFVTSGKGLYTSDGVLMYLLDAQTASGGAETNYLFYSTDEGATWHVDANVVATGANEAKLVELGPGKLLSSTRSAYSRIFNEGTYTKNSDGTCTFEWGSQRTESLLTQNGSGNNQDVIVYNRNADQSARVLIHTITSGNGHKTLKLFMSIDQGASWNEVMQVQPGGSRYCVTTVLPNGDLGILFEDYSLETGNQYPINFLTVKKEQIEEWYEELEEEVYSPLVKNSLQGSTTGCDSWGSFSNASSGWYTTWTSNDASGKAGVTVVATGNDFLYATVYGQRVMAMRPSSNEATDEITITAPEGFYIDSYTIGGRNYSGYQSYKLIAPDGTEVSTNASTVSSITVENVNSPSSTFQFYGSSTTNYLCITNFTIQLKSRYPVALNVVGEKSYATLYLPFDVTTDTDTKAYYASEVANGVVTLVDLDGNIAAHTAVVLINDAAATEATFTLTSGLTQTVDKDANLLKGTLEDMQLDLGQDTPYYSMGRKDGKIGFYKFDNNGTTTITLGANKAYLDTTAPAGSSKGFTFSFGQADGIESVEKPEPSNVGATVYNLAGQRVSRVTKGLYIVNGKKTVIR